MSDQNALMSRREALKNMMLGLGAGLAAVGAGHVAWAGSGKSSAPNGCKGRGNTAHFPSGKYQLISKIKKRKVLKMSNPIIAINMSKVANRPERGGRGWPD